MSYSREFKVGDRVIDLYSDSSLGVGTVMRVDFYRREYLIYFHNIHQFTNNLAVRDWEYSPLILATPLMEVLL